MFTIVCCIHLDSLQTKRKSRQGLTCLQSVTKRGPQRRPCLTWIGGWSSPDSNLTWWHLCRHCASCVPCMPGMSMVFRALCLLWVQGMTTSGQIAHNCRIKHRGGINCLKACNIVTTRKGSRFGPKMQMKLNESEGTRTQGPPGLACKVLRNS